MKHENLHHDFGFQYILQNNLLPVNSVITFSLFNITLYFWSVTSISKVFHSPIGFDAVFEGLRGCILHLFYEEDYHQALPSHQFEFHTLY